MKPFVQLDGHLSTLTHWREILEGNDLRTFGAFAYVTDSGVAQIRTHLGACFGGARSSRWLLGFDYGRSQPAALRHLASIANSDVRIHDGNYVVQSPAFVPRVNYHLKTLLTLSENGYPFKQIVGSGNLSASGLSSGIEAGCVVDFSAIAQQIGDALITALEGLWDSATPLAGVIADYEMLYPSVNNPVPHVPVEEHQADASELFWIDIGYVTKNRGQDRPGNQFDLPRRSHIYLGLDEVAHPIRNSILGELMIKTPTGEVVERRLRYGDNAMEKLTLPIPEQYGYECYDGKILTFKRDGDEIVLEALEQDDFYRVYGPRITSCSEMQSGRRYGTIAAQVN